MKTKELIKLLQEEDPSGELHVRVREAGMPTSACCYPGYYDGGYAYEEDGKMVLTKTGSKVDIYCSGYDDLIFDCQGDMDKIRKRLIIEKDCGSWEQIEKEAAEVRVLYTKLQNECLVKALNKIKIGWSIVQSKDKPIGHYNVMRYRRANFPSMLGYTEENLVQGECGAVLKSGFFEHIEREDCIEWILNIRK